MSEANLFIKNPNGEIQGVGCSPFFLLQGTAKGCTLNLQSQDDFWKPVGNYSWERLTLKNSYGAQSSYWGDGRLQKGKSVPIENNAHEFTSEKISFEKLFILKEPVQVGTNDISELEWVFQSKDNVESSIEQLSTSIDLTLYDPVPIEKTPAELQAEEEASLEIETGPELEVIPQAGANSGYSEQSHLLYAGTGVTDPYVYSLAAPNEDGKLRKTKSIAGPDPVTGIWTGSLGASQIVGDSSQYAGNTHYSWKPIEENWPADLQFDDKCQWTTCIRLNDNSFLTTNEYTAATLDRRPINFGDTITEYIKRSWEGGRVGGLNFAANSYTFTGTKGQYFEIDVSVPENSNTRPNMLLEHASTKKTFIFNEQKLPGGPSNTSSLDRNDWDGELKLGTEFSKGFIGTLPEDGTYNITVQAIGPDVTLPNWLQGFQLGSDIDDTGTSVNINTMQNIVEFGDARNLELVGSMWTINQEIFKVTEVVNNNTVTADRAQDGTFAQNHKRWNKASILIGTKTERHFTDDQYGEKITVSLTEGGVRVVKPVAPTSISTEAGAGSVKVTWLAPTMDIEGRSNPIIDGYTIGARTKETHGSLEARANNPGITVTVGSDATSATLNGLTNGLRYYIYVTANNEKGSSSEALGGSKTVIPTKPSPFSAYANTVNWDNTGEATYFRETKFLCPDPDMPGSLKDFCDPEENGSQTYSVDCGTPLTTIMDPNSVRRSLVGYDGQPIDFSWDMNANSMHSTSRVPGKVGQDLLLNYSLYPNSIPSYAGCVNSEITVDGEIDEWPFEGKAGQWVEITMDPTYLGDKWSYRPNLDKLIPVLELVAPNLPSGSVPFSKSVDLGVPVGEDISCYASYCSSGEIYPGETKGGYIKSIRDTDIWKFEAIAGEKYNIVIEFNPNLGIASEQRYGKNFDTGMPLSTKEYHLKHGPL